MTPCDTCKSRDTWKLNDPRKMAFNYCSQCIAFSKYRPIEAPEKNILQSSKS